MSDELSRPVYSTEKPIAIDRIAVLSDALRVLYGPDLYVQDRGNRFVFFTEGEQCDCHHCSAFLEWFAPGASNHMIVCPDCGNKRCPKATHHMWDCTGSNEPGQPGSEY